MDIVVFGHGRQGQLVARDILEADGANNVTVVDIADRKNNLSQPYSYIKADLSNYNVVRDICKKNDLAIGCLPARLGLVAISAAIDSGTNYIDISFLDYDVLKFDGSAIYNDITVIPDAGIAPGLSNLIVGRAVHTRKPSKIEVHVGGIAADKDEDYIISWSPEDLQAEYTRPVKIIQNNKINVVKALSGMENLNIPDIGVLESFYTDGLRSLLKFKDQVNYLAEKTMRWPGHIDNIIIPMLGRRNFTKEIQERFKSAKDSKDILVMFIKVDNETVMLKVTGDQDSAMTKATAHSCSSFAALLASSQYDMPGVIPPEKISKDDLAYKFILDNLSKHGIEFDTRYPFL